MVIQNQAIGISFIKNKLMIMQKISTNFLLALSVITMLFSCREPIPVPEPELVCETIEENIVTTTTWTNRISDPDVPDYCVTKEIYIGEGAGLIIEPGVVVEFAQGAGINLAKAGITSGYLVAEGVESQKIVFTGKEKIPGFWRGIYVPYNSTDVRSVLDHCIVEYAGSEELGSFSAGFGYKAGVGVALASHGELGLISIKNTTIRHTNGKGYACKEEVGLNEFENNHFENNSEEAIYIGVNGFSKIDGNTTFQDNLVDGVSQALTYTTTQVIDDGFTHRWEALSGGHAYYIQRDVAIKTGGVEVTEGANIVISSAKKIRIDENGYLNAIGTSANPISFSGKTPGTPSWNSIHFLSNNTQNVMRFCNISEAGVGTINTHGANGAASIGIDYWAGKGGSLTITQSTISNGGGCGIFIDVDNVGNLDQSDNAFVSLAGADICN